MTTKLSLFDIGRTIFLFPLPTTQRFQNLPGQILGILPTNLFGETYCVRKEDEV